MALFSREINCRMHILQGDYHHAPPLQIRPLNVDVAPKMKEDMSTCTSPHHQTTAYICSREV